MCSNLKMLLKDEFKCANFGLSHSDPTLFTKAQWKWHPAIYIVWRVAMAAYFTAWCILSGTWEYDWYTTQYNRITWFVYLTNWSFFMFVLMLLVQAVLVLLDCFRHHRVWNVSEGEGDIVLPWYLKMQWVLYNIGTTHAISVTVIFYSYFVSPGDTVHPVDIHTHGINGLVALLDLFITAQPLRMLHFFHSLTFGVVYLIFSVIYTMAGGHNGSGKPYIYIFFDFKEDPGMAVLHALVFCVFCVFVTWVVICILYTLRLKLAQCLRKEDPKEEEPEPLPMKMMKTDP